MTTALAEEKFPGQGKALAWSAKKKAEAVYGFEGRELGGALRGAGRQGLKASGLASRVHCLRDRESEIKARITRGPPPRKGRGQGRGEDLSE